MQNNQAIFDKNYTAISASTKNNFSFYFIIAAFMLAIMKLFLLNSPINMVLTMLSIGLIFLAFVVKVNSIDYLTLFSLMSICIGFINTMLNGSGLGSILVFVALILLFELGRYTVFTRRQSMSINLWCFIALAAFLIMYSKKVNGMFNNILFSSVYNPNGYAIVVITAGMLSYGVIDQYRVNKVIKKLLYCISCILVFALIIYTSARTSMLAWAAFNFFIVVDILIEKHNNKNNNNKKNVVKNKYLQNNFLFLIIFLSILGIGVYLLIYEIFGDQFKILGKSLFTGRELIWKEALVLIMQNPILGNSNDYMFMGNFLNTHNGFIALQFYLGIIPFIAFVLSYGNSFRTAKSTNSCAVDKYKIFALGTFIIMGAFEAMFMDLTYFIMMLPFCFNKGRIESNDKEDYSLLLVRK